MGAREKVEKKYEFKFREEALTDQQIESNKCTTILYKFLFCEYTKIGSLKFHMANPACYIKSSDTDRSCLINGHTALTGYVSYKTNCDMVEH